MSSDRDSTSSRQPEPRTRRFFLRIVRGLAFVFLLLAFLLAGLFFSLRFSQVQQAVLAVVSDATEGALGFSITADNIRLDLAGGSLGLDGLAMTAAAAMEPFSTADKVDLRIRWSSLVGERVQLPSMTISGLRIDLDQPMPSPDSTPSNGEGGIDIASIDIGSIEVTGAVPGDGETWLHSWELTEGSVTGSFLGDRLQAIATSRISMAARWPGTEEDDIWTGHLELSLSADPEVGFELPRVSLVGEGVQLTLSAQGQFEPIGLEASFEARIEPSRFWPDADDLGTLEILANTQLDSGLLLGDLKVETESLAGELLDPWLAEIGLRGLATTGTRIETDADLHIAVDLSSKSLGADLIRGRIESEWRRAEEVLLDLEIRADEPTSLAPEAAAHLTIATAVRPAGVDLVEASADLDLAAWTRWEKTELRDVRADIDIADLQRFLTGLWKPPESVELWLPAGTISASAKLKGPALAPLVDGELRWMAGDELLLTATAARLAGSLSVEPLEIGAAILPDLPGLRKLGARISLGNPPHSPSLKVDLALPDVSSLLEDLSDRWPTLFPRSPEALAELDPALVYSLARGSLTAQLEAEGSWQQPSLDLEVDWRPDEAQRGVLKAGADLSWERPFFEPGARGELTLHGVDLSDWPWNEGEEASPVSGQLSGRLSVAQLEDGRFEGSTDLELHNFALGETPWLQQASLHASFVDHELEIAELSGRLALTSPKLEGARFEAGGRLVIAPELAGDLSLRLRTPGAPLAVSTADLVVEDGIVELRATVEGQAGIAVVEAPLGSLADLFGKRLLPAFSEGLARGPVRTSFDTASIGPWSEILLPVGAGFSLAGELHGEIEIDLSHPMKAEGEIVITDLAVMPDEGDALAATTPLRLSIAGGRLALEQLELEGEGGAKLVVSGSTELDQAWEMEDPWADLLGQPTLIARGKLDASILNPVLGGGLASGAMSVELEVGKSSGELVLNLDLEAPDATLFFPTGLVTRIDSPRFHLRAQDGVVELQEGKFVLNRGSVELDGRWEEEKGIRLDASFDQVRYRVDYGLNVILDGRLGLTKRPGRAGVLSGRAVVDRGSLRRDIFLDREFVRAFTFDESAADPDSAVDRIELDLIVTTRQGIHIKNNIADLRLDWGNLTVEGTIGEPLVSGRIDSDPGGWLEALGQLFRVDSLSIELFGDPSVEPLVEVETTGLLDDPTLYQQRREGLWAGAMNADSAQNDLFWSEQQHGSEAAMTQFTSGLVTYFGDRLARTVGHGATMQFTVQPLPLYGETSSDGRVTLSQRLGRYLTFIASSDTRDTESVTYILQSADLIPKTTFQLFTNDDKNEGATMQVVQPLLRKRRVFDTTPRLGRIEWRLPETIKERHIRRAMTFRKRDPFPDGSDFDVEIDVVEALQSLGFPGSTIEVTPDREEDGSVNLLIAVATGPHLDYVFEGIRIPLGFRETIAARYLPSEIDRGASLESVRAETERTLRRLGHLAPSVTVTEEALDDLAFEAYRLLRIVSTADRQINLDVIRFEGLPEADALALVADYDSALTRIELAEELANADLLLLRRAAALGFPGARIVDRHLSELGDELTVTMEPGPRQRIASFEVVGLPVDHRDLAESLSISEGDPVRRRDLSREARSILTGLRERGFMVAGLDLSVTPTSHVDDLVDVVFTISPGPRLELAGTEFRGLEHTKPFHAQSLAEIEPGQPLQAATLGSGRRNLFRSTLFERIDMSLQLEDGRRLDEIDDAELGIAGDEIQHVTAVFELEEGPRFLASYGGRWESTRGTSVIGDLIDRNFRGIGQTLGLRGVYGESERRLRLYYSLPRKPFKSSTMEIFLETSKEKRALEACDVPADLRSFECLETKKMGGGLQNTVDLDIDELSARFQLTFPLGPATQMRPFLELKNRDVTVTDGLPSLTAQQTGGDSDDLLDRVISPALGVQIAHDTRSGSTTGGLSEGYFLGFQINGTHEALGSDLTATEVISEAKIFKQVATWRQMPVVWAHRYRLGVQLTTGDERVPVFDQYFAGGEYSLRGYPTESFGPGQAQLVINQELHFPVWSLFTGLVFFDAGNVWETFSTMRDEFELFANLGIGLRFSAFRFDVSVPLDPRLNDPDYQFLFGFGNAF